MIKKCALFMAIILIFAAIISAFPASAAVSYESIKKNPGFHYGIDVSKWNGDLDWDALKKKGIEFAYIRVGMYDNKGGHLDEKFQKNVKGCVENGIEFGVYVYSNVYKHNKVKSCAKWVSKQIEKLGNYTKDKNTIQVAYDIEDSSLANAVINKKISKSYLQKSVIKFSNAIKNKGYIPVVYSYESFFTNYLNLSDLQNRGYRIWFARWPNVNSLDTTKKYIMPNNTNPDVWQYSSSFYINGVNLDTNVCYDDFYDYTKENSKVTVTGLKDIYSYSSKGVEPEISVYYKNTLLTKNVDYKLKYFSNKSPGIGRIKIIRYKNGEYQDTKTVKFTIKATKVKKLTAVAKNTSIKLSWNQHIGASYYKIYEYCDETNRYEYIYTTDETNITFIELNRNTEYSYKVSAVTKINSNIYEGKKAKVTAKTK
ncbi:MAG: GH25 family lysozyme [Ruminococcus sp.]